MTLPEEPEERDASDDAELEEEDTEQSTAQDPTKEEAAETPTSSDVQESAPAPLPPVQVPDRYEIHRCKLSFSITMLEDDGHPDGRQVLIGVRNDEDVPLTELVRASGLPTLLPALVTLQARLESDLPQRQETMRLTLEDARRKQAAKTTPKREAKPRQTTTPPVATMPAAPQHEEVVVAEPPQPAVAEEKAAAQAAQTTAKATKTKHSTRQQEDESPFEQMTLFG
ncbi:hypothetical protein KDA_75910 [Dictyobacter alpinus]|uniref:Uncharacterized protein n=1 Tax=Dictyobacter alpinus TaxID=2014873 RepID=A0A402BL67_9CHLR|nr:hypothetical protein [Dictyobacter alpinus]GCE32107.1 hypothetical protein KDA_75910 [Dictyobacter alpinus]